MGPTNVGEKFATEKEVTVMTVWPTLAATRYGRWWGRQYENAWGITLLGLPITVGRIVALLSIPFILPLYFHMLIPRLPGIILGVPNPACGRYRLTSQRVLVEQAFGDAEWHSVPLADFSSIEIEVLPGQSWYPAGDLVFRNGPTETLRLRGVPHPEPFRRVCLKTQAGFLSVQQARTLHGEIDHGTGGPS